MATGQGEQRAVHPFFRKEFGSSERPSPQPTDPSQVAASLPRNDPMVPFDGSSNGQNHVSSHDSTLLEHDPNSSRRKRRRTEEPSEVKLVQDPEVNYSPRPEEINPTVDTVAATDEPAVGGGPQSGAADKPDSHPTTPGPSSANGIEPAGDTTALKGTSERRSARQKTIGLNPNGKLLSSPVTSHSEDKLGQKTGGKRGNARKAKQDGQKLVIIKYAEDSDTGERIGNMIDDILSGRKKHIPLERQPLRPPPPKADTQPPKATHPFFLKKPAPQVEAPSSGEQTPDTPEAKGLVQDAQTSLPAVPRKPDSATPKDSTKSFSFKPRPKLPEPIHPLWPPQDLVHVRGSPAGSCQRETVHLKPDQKKAKMSAIRINDKENVLLSNLHRARTSTHQEAHTLREPDRSTASGKTLHKAVVKQLPESGSACNPDRKGTTKALHPALSKLNALVPTSMSAFDQGKFEKSLWSQKYAPNSAEEVLQPGREAVVLRDWLRYLTVSAVDTGKPPKDADKSKQDRKRAKKRRKPDKLDGFIVSSEDDSLEMDELADSDEDELAGDVTTSFKRTVVRSGDIAAGAKHGAEKARVSNAILLSGPSGCGKTASVYAVAKELDFEVFEIHPGNRRSARDVIERVGDMTRNHLVHNLDGGDETPSRQSPEINVPVIPMDEPKQNKLKSFFESSSSKGQKGSEKAGRKNPEPDVEAKRSRNQKQSLILLEEADVLFEEDKQFWSGVMALISQSRRPIIITCNTENLIPIADISLHAILRYRTPPLDLAVEYLLLIAANEGHLIKRDAAVDLYAANGRDLRRSITDLNFWCQMAIGSKKSGLDWMLDRWPPGSDLDVHGDPLRVISLNAYQPWMGWFNRDALMDNSLDSEVESQQDSLDWWQLSLQDSEVMAESRRQLPSSPRPESKQERIERLRLESEYADMRSSLDILCSGCSVNPKLDAIDFSVPPIAERQRANYIEGYPLLHADLQPDYFQLPAAIGSTFSVLMGKVFRPDRERDVESSQATQVLQRANKPRTEGSFETEWLAAFEPVMQAHYTYPPPTGRVAPSFEHGTGPLTEDLAPYIRAIMAYDLRLEQHRLRLSGLLSAGTKRMRKTRASRAALEGGTKADTRKERWFPSDASPSRILATGNKAWQDLLVETGHFTVGNVLLETSRESTTEGHENGSESSGDGGI